MKRRAINPDKFGGPYSVLKDEAEVEAQLARQRAAKRFVYESIIEEDDDPEAVERATEKLAEIDAKEDRAG